MERNSVTFLNRRLGHSKCMQEEQGLQTRKTLQCDLFILNRSVGKLNVGR